MDPTKPEEHYFITSWNLPLTLHQTLYYYGSMEIHNFDPCTDNYANAYLNLPEVQKAFHANLTKWYSCSGLGWHDSPTTILPTIKQLMASNISVCIYRQVQNFVQIEVHFEP
ncbi:hypothetical protein IFM89_007463 [Coptis chinensis]|uniref:Uncharacterized protein n=1 Tax=Coptis chinensis TaxID=261450 RepID=A0A835I6F8_9MAGN|nr:hypothetical protein IFM89_007463 [Coptis chinensis]